MLKHRYFTLLLVSYFILFATQGYGFNVQDKIWPQPSTTFHVDIPGESGLWDTAFEAAMGKWSSSTSFTFFIVLGSFIDPCQNPNDVPAANGVKFNSTVCGDAFGSTTLAVELSWVVDGTTTQSGIVFNNNESWDVYSGPPNFSVNDFRRVAVHELGHSLGLNHEDAITSIMVAIGLDLEIPQLDDIRGVSFIYGGVNSPNCNVITPIGTNTTIQGALSPTDCTVRELTGDLDDTLVDVYSITLESAGILTVDLSSATFDAFLGLISEDGSIAESDDDSGIGTNSRLVVNMPAGVHAIFANSFTEATGSYTLKTTFELVDTDSDGVSDNRDNCPSTSNSNQLDTDGDGSGDACDSDDDNDGVPDSTDVFPLDPNETVDTDNDGIGDNRDNCPSTPNSDHFDTDNDGSGDACDSDDDNDGVPDSTDKFPLNASDSVDTDNDGMGNNFENTYGLNPLAPGDASLDTDGDGLTNLEEFQVGRIPTVHEGALIEIINSIILEE